MADITKTISIIFQGDDQITGSMSVISTGFGQLEGAVMSVVDPLAKVADEALKAQAALVALGTAGLGMAVREAGAFRESIAEVATLIQDTSFNVGEFEDSILQYARGSTQSLEDISRAVYSAVSAGVSYKDALSAMAQAENLSTAGRAELNESLVLVVSSMNAYGASSEETERYVDTFFNTVRLGQTTVPELAANLSKVTGVAGATKIPIEELGAALATMTARGMDTAEATTALRAMINSILQPSAEAAKAFGELGIEYGANALAGKGLGGVLGEIYEKTDGNIDVISQMFGNVRGLTGALQAFGADGGDKYLSNLDSMKEKQGMTAEAAKLMGEQMSNVWQNMVNNLRATLIEQGQPFLDGFLESVKGMASVFEGLSVGFSGGAFDPVRNELLSVQGTINDFINGVAKALPEAMEMVDWTKFLAGMRELNEALGGIFDALFGGMDLTQPEDLARVLQDVVDAIGNLGAMSAGIVEQWGPLIRTLSELISGFGSLDTETAKASGQIAGSAQVFKALEERLGFTGALAAEFGIHMLTSADNVDSARENVAMLVNVGGRMVDAPLDASLAWLELGGAVVDFGDKLGGLPEPELAIGTDDIDRARVLLSDLGDFVDTVSEERMINLILENRNLSPELEALAQKIDAVTGEKEIPFSIESIETARRAIESLGVFVADLTDEQVIALVLDKYRFDPQFQAAVQNLESLTREKFNATLALDDSDLDQAKKKLLDVGYTLDGLSDEAIIKLAAMLDKGSLVGVTDDLDAIDPKAVAVQAEADKASLAETVKDIEEKIPKEKQMTIEAKIKVAELESEAKKVQAAFDAMAKISVAEIEGNAKKVAAAFDSIGEGLSASSKSVGDLLSAWSALNDQSGPGSWQKQDTLMGLIRQEYRMKEKLLKEQSKLIGAEVDWMQARTRAINRGDALIQIDGTHMAPHLEAIMWEMLGAIQVRASEEGQAMLLGM